MLLKVLNALHSKIKKIKNSSQIAIVNKKTTHKNATHLHIPQIQSKYSNKFLLALIKSN